MNEEQTKEPNLFIQSFNKLRADHLVTACSPLSRPKCEVLHDSMSKTRREIRSVLYLQRDFNVRREMHIYINSKIQGSM